MHQPSCPACQHQLAPANMNVGQGVAVCPACGVVSALAALAVSETLLRVDTQRPPEGCSEEEDLARDQTVLRVSAFSWGAALGTWFVTLFWNGITGVFVVIGVGGVLYNLGVIANAPATESGTGQPMSLGSSIFMVCFITPFVAIGMLMLATALTTTFGGYIVRVGDETTSVCVGVGPFSWTRSVRNDRVRGVDIGETAWKMGRRGEGSPRPVVAIEHDKTMRFGSTIPDERRNWMAARLRELLVS